MTETDDPNGGHLELLEDGQAMGLLAMDLVEDLTKYYSRAVNQVKPPGYAELPDEHDHETFAAAFPRTASANTFLNDVSEFQPPVDSRYPYAAIDCRAHSGWRLDNNAVPNRNFLYGPKNDHIRLKMWYGVAIENQLAVFKRDLINLLGKECPPFTVFMVDMESGTGFAGPGNHSAMGNAYLEFLAEYSGSTRRVFPYANYPDFINCWPGLLNWARSRRWLAAYTSTEPSFAHYGWQYGGGNPNWGSPAGYPRKNANFGSYVDYNVIHHTIDWLLQDMGFVKQDGPVVAKDWWDTVNEDQALAVMKKALASAEGQAAIKKAVGPYFTGTDKKVHAVEAIVSHVTHGTQYYTHKGKTYNTLSLQKTLTAIYDALNQNAPKAATEPESLTEERPAELEDANPEE
jgi:hypothetical protein